MLKTLLALALAVAFLTGGLGVTAALAAEDAPSTPAPAEEENSSSAPTGIGHGGKRCGSGHAPSA